MLYRPYSTGSSVSLPSKARFNSRTLVETISLGFGFHYIDTRGLFTKYKLHTSAEDLTKNRASRKDVIKFALIQQAANCTLGYLMANDSEQFVSPEYATALWAQRLRNIEVMVTRCVPYIGYLWPWAAYESNGSGYAASSAIRPGTLGNLLSNTTQALDISQMDPTPFTSQEIVLANAMYWVLVPLFQYIVAMVLADTLQYFTHRAFHVNKWLYSMRPPRLILGCSFDDSTRACSLDAP